MRKCLFNIVSAVLIFAFFISINICAEAKENAEIRVETVECISGEAVDVGVEVCGNPGIIAIGIDISYDEECLEFTGADDGNLYKSASFTPCGDLKQVPFRIMWEDALAESDHTDNGMLAVLHFKVSDTAPEGMSEIKISVSEKNTFNIDLKDVHFDAVNGGVDIKKITDISEADAADEKNENKINETTDIESVIITGFDSAEEKYFMPVDKMCEMVSEDFEKKTGEKPDSVETVVSSDGKLKIVLKNKIGSVIGTYSVDTVTGKGIDSNNNDIDLSGVKDTKITIIAAIAAALILASVLVIVIVKRSKSK